MEAHKYEELPDPMLSRYNESEMSRFVDCAAACVRRPCEGRPALRKVVRFLEGNLSLNQLNEGIASPGASSTSGDTNFFSLLVSLPSNPQSFNIRATPLMEAHKYEELADPMLSRYNESEMSRFVDCAAACVRRPREGRPAMSKVKTRP
ncbi:uncharacterized protein LOC143853774 isoform X2 [Tasmannia lanceolata]|uniref:uncharacterized protein LOC143853774 isoform X2 n=1 Tax=Tasmannia lanceolata TaxID=3420 RepID=UPI0040644767